MKTYDPSTLGRPPNGMKHIRALRQGCPKYGNDNCKLNEQQVLYQRYHWHEMSVVSNAEILDTPKQPHAIGTWPGLPEKDKDCTNVQKKGAPSYNGAERRHPKPQWLC